MNKKFSRHVDKKIIDELVKTPLWKEKLRDDCEAGEVFLAIRPGYIRFYHQGGGLFEFHGRDFQTHIKYASVIDRQDKKGDYITQAELKKTTLVKDFIHGYDEIKANCETYSKGEASGVASLYHKYSYLKNDRIMILDIEVAFDSLQKESGMDRIDILLYNNIEKKLRFIEAKHFSNSELFAKNKHPHVIDQIDRYKDQIKKRRAEILTEYCKAIGTLKRIFDNKLLALQEPCAIDNKVGLLVFGFDQNQQDGRLKGYVTGNAEFRKNGIPIYSIGGNEINAEVLWQKTS